MQLIVIGITSFMIIYLIKKYFQKIKNIPKVVIEDKSLEDLQKKVDEIQYKFDKLFAHHEMLNQQVEYLSLESQNIKVKYQNLKEIFINGEDNRIKTKLHKIQNKIIEDLIEKMIENNKTNILSNNRDLCFKHFKKIYTSVN